jgi:hypothetical protein
VVRSGMMVVALAVAGGADAAPFSMSADGAGSAWVLDEATGALRVCRTVAAMGPKVLDVFGAVAEVRPGVERAARPTCVVTLGPIEEPVAVPPRGMLGDGSSGPQVGSAAGMLGDGGWGWGWGDAAENQIVIIRPGSVAIGLY